MTKTAISTRSVHRRLWNRLTCILATGALALLTSPTLFAQGTTASLGGTVQDASGAVVPGANVVLTNEASHDQRTSESNGAGVFSFSAVPTGDYDIQISAQGFSTFQQKAIHLDPGDQRTVRDIKLAVGASTQTVEVTSAVDQVNLDSGEQSSLISSQEIQRLSVEGRDVTELLKILPGFAISNGGSGSFDNRQYDPSQVNPTGALGQYAANGTPVNGQALLSDGVDITDPGAFGGALQNVNYEQVAEVKVQTSSFTADTAHGPIVINAVGKAGGDAYHGSLYIFARTYQLNSNDWVANYTHQPRPNDRYVYPGFTFGGPVIPGGHHKALTFFVGAEDYAQRNVYAYGSASAATLTALVPTAGMRAGDFSAAQLQQYLGNGYQIDPKGGACAYNPAYNGASAPGAANSYSTSGYIPDANICRVPVTAPNGSPLANGNIGAYLDPLSKVILNEMPLPNTTSNGTYNWITTNLVNNNLWQAHGRMDFNPSEKNKFFGNYGIEKGASGVPQNEYYSARGSIGGINVPGGGLISTIDSHLASLDYTHIFGPTLTNEFYAAGAYFSQDFVAKTPSAVANNPYQGVFVNGSNVQPTLEDYGNDGLPLLRTPDTSYGGIFAKKQVRIAGDNLTKVVGKHTLRGGIFYQWDSNPQVSPFVNTNGTVNLYYIGETVNDPVKGNIHSTGVVGSGNGGNYLADFGEGMIFQYNQTNIMPEPNLYFWNMAEYVEDHWRLTSRVSIDAGVRFEHMTPWEDSHHIGIAVFSPSAYANGTNPLLPGMQWHANNSSIPLGGRPTRWGFVEPRLGFAWDTTGTGTTVVRGGFGIYRAHDAYNDAANQQETTLGLRTYTVNGPLLLSSVSSYQSKVPPNAFSPDSNAYAFDPKDDEEPRVRTYNLAVDQRIPGGMLVELAYVGNVSDKLLNDGSTQNTSLDNINSLPVGALFAPQPNTRPDLLGTPTTGSNGVVTYKGGDPCYSPGAYHPVIGPSSGQNCSVGSLSQAVVDSYKKYPLYNHLYVPEHNTYSNYNGLQVALARQVGHAHFNVNYTWSKALGILGMGGSATYSYPGDPFNYRNDYTSMPFDRRHIFNASYSYEFGRLVNNKFAGGVTNGWMLSGISNYQSGPNLQSVISSNFGLSGSLTVPYGAVAAVGNNVSTCAPTKNGAPNLSGTCQVSLSNTTILGTPDVNLQPTLVAVPNAVHRSSQQYINASAFSLPSLGTNGPYKFGYLPGPGFFDTDLTAEKSFHLAERLSMRLRVAAFNVLNHANNAFANGINNSSYTMNFSQTVQTTNVNQALASANASANPNFGYANVKEGRRIMELGLHFDF